MAKITSQPDKAPDVVVKRSASQHACSGCRKGLGKKVFPVNAHSVDGKESERWCPACFVQKRAPMEPGRWRAIAALLCKVCGSETLATGVANRKRCVNCGSSETVPSRPAKAAG